MSGQQALGAHVTAVRLAEEQVLAYEAEVDRVNQVAEVNILEQESVNQALQAEVCVHCVCNCTHVLAICGLLYMCGFVFVVNVSCSLIHDAHARIFWGYRTIFPVRLRSMAWLELLRHIEHFVEIACFVAVVRATTAAVPRTNLFSRHRMKGIVVSLLSDKV